MARSIWLSTLGSSRAIRAPLFSLVKHMSSISPPTLSLLYSDEVSVHTTFFNKS